MRIIIEDTDRIFADVLRLLVEPDAPLFTGADILNEMRVARDIPPPPSAEQLPESARLIDPIPPHPAPAADLDTEGLPWYEKLHSSSREKNKDGTWRVKRNTGKEETARLKAELKALMAGGKGVRSHDPVAIDDTISAHLTAPPPPPATPLAAGAPPPPPPVVNDPFSAFLTRMSNRMSAGEFNMDTWKAKYNAYALSLGIENGGTMLFMRDKPELIPAFEAQFKGGVA